MAGEPSSRRTFQMRLENVSAMSSGALIFQRFGNAGASIQSVMSKSVKRFSGNMLSPTELKAEHQIHVLNGSTRGALSEIVIDRNQQRLRPVVIGKDIDLHPIGAVIDLGIYLGQALHVLVRSYLDHAALDGGKMVGDCRVQF